ncbi:SulP family inorganic anion transporter [Peterkaempfera bronchialis]|uniref:SulP family inorganic anion transporter n=1 Tax=Peterkaempfera bronchialis TaxID=2126346 RepID=A0A345SZG9_9ACTN|nr:SulP family inorganic anion transporter [Peterkaempfera bronchialis]AXI79124.1 SulP family inorganic anion transporter [Peterkaempfera bronchialis]
MTPRSSLRSAFRRPPFLRQDLAASLVVFLVAVPLCVGIAVASGAPAELGLVTGIVGGLVTGLLPGSSLQVSGPAAGLTVLVHQAVTTYGLPALGAVVLAAGVLQVAMGVLRLGRWFRAISVSVVQGMLAGIGLVLIAGQLYPMLGAQARSSAMADLAGLPALLAHTAGSPRALTAAAIGGGALLVLLGWRWLPARVRAVPGPLAAVVLATAVTAAAGLDVATVEVHGLLASVQPPGLSDLERLAGTGLLGTAVAFALIASAESLFSAAAVDRLHNGPRTHYDRELVAQGVGNTVCGLLGALPMTAVIVRSATNVHAGARTRLSRVLHGCWLLLFAALLPAALGMIPLAALAAVLVHAGAKLVPVAALRPLWQAHRGEAVVLVVTAVAVTATNLLEGVLLGLLLAVVKSAWETSHLKVEVVEAAEAVEGPAAPILVRLSGNATFLRLPGMLGALETLPQGRPVTLDLADLLHVDHACRTALHDWAARREGEAEGEAEGGAEGEAESVRVPTP